MNKNHKFDKHFKKLSEEENQEKYIKEMHEMADKNAKKNNAIFISVIIPILIICVIVIKQICSFSFNVSKNTKSQPTTSQSVNNNSNKTKTKKGNTKNNEVLALNSQIAKYIENQSNREKSLKEALKINKDSNKGVSIIYISQILRDNKLNIPKNTISTKGLMQELEKQNWEKITDYKKLQKGDICFTTTDNSGSPSHAYIFMGWINEGKTDYANVCDGQISDYSSTIHKRNVSISTSEKDKIAFFMRKPNK
ncbi:hypothetical protein FDF74_06540 [Clostridium niameyense]|uniref:Bacteriophage lysin domain-containing protein n=1 Tax=Clostridium niameyense TaxID=1622073 RepID=A0A6M0R9E0_9CLOT|nr:hypothetical protein [Clostridium niameyense]NEZ46871.1 hypothetical protein [Clostridium niameyense]